MKTKGKLEEEARKIFEEFRGSPQAKENFVPHVLEKMHLKGEKGYSPSRFKKEFGCGEEYLSYFPEIDSDKAKVISMVMNGIWCYEGSWIGLIDLTNRRYSGSVCHPEDNPEFTGSEIPSTVSWRREVIDF